MDILGHCSIVCLFGPLVHLVAVMCINIIFIYIFYDFIKTRIIYINFVQMRLRHQLRSCAILRVRIACNCSNLNVYLKRTTNINFMQMRLYHQLRSCAILRVRIACNSSNLNIYLKRTT
jgi:hypothetical protein